MRFYEFLIIGSNGLLGSNIVSLLKKKKFKYKTSARNNSNFNLNLKNFYLLEKIFKENSFKYVINCAAKINIDSCERYYKQAFLINSLVPKNLTKLSTKYDFKLIQISTDAFYLNTKNILNKETNRLYAINNYSKTKLLGEKFVKKNKKSLIIRTNFTGREFKKNSKRFVDWIYRTIKYKKKINLFSDMYTSTIDVQTCAKTILDLIHTEAYGIYNLGTRDALSKLQFALKFSKKLKKELIHNPTISKISSITPRNNNLGLNVSKIERKLKRKMISSSNAITNLSKDYL